MKQSTKGLLLSLLVCPGAGHLAHKKFIPGVAFMSVAALCIYYLVTTAYTYAMTVIKKIEAEGVILSPEKVIELARFQPTGSQMDWINLATYTLILLWIVSGWDAYRIGNKLDQHNKKDTRA